MVLSAWRRILLQSYLQLSVNSYLTEKNTQTSLALPPPKDPVSVLLRSHRIINTTSELFLITTVDHQKLDFLKFLFSSLFVAREGTGYEIAF